MTNETFKSKKIDLELQKSQHFMQWVTMRDPIRIEKLDQAKDRKRPDFAFYYPSNKCYILEITSWLSPQLKNLQNFLETRIAQLLGNNVSGTFALYVHFDKLTNGKIKEDQLNKIVGEITQFLNSQDVNREYTLSIGTIAKVKDDGHKLVPVITVPETVYLDEDDKKTKGLKANLNNILNEAKGKFKDYSGIRVLLLDIEHNGLDIDYHSGILKDGPGIICRWLSTLLGSSTDIHYICLSQGMRVWDPQTFRRLLTKHVYEGLPFPHYSEAWRKAGIPPILQSL